MRATAQATEHNYDYVTLYDGPTTDDATLAFLSGSMSDISDYQHVTASGRDMAVQFTSDGSVAGTGFDLHWSCGGGH